LPPADRAELADYARSGFDRGHMAPNGDMPTENAQYESFSLANIVPQSPKNNQILWNFTPYDLLPFKRLSPGFIPVLT